MSELGKYLVAPLTYTITGVAIISITGIWMTYALYHKAKELPEKIKGKVQKLFLPRGTISYDTWMPLERVKEPHNKATQLEILAIKGKDYLLDQSYFGTHIRGRVLAVTNKPHSNAQHITLLPYDRLPPAERTHVNTHMAHHYWQHNPLLTEREE